MSDIKRPNHLHRYHRKNIGAKPKKYYVFKCTKPLCNHYVPLHLAEGQMCECNRCNEPMLLNKAALMLSKPHCSNCVKRKKAPDVDAITEYLERIKTPI